MKFSTWMNKFEIREIRENLFLFFQKYLSHSILKVLVALHDEQKF